MKIAVVVMVKDEAEDILPWLCWYIDLGVNTILFFDDSSTDGTYEIAQEVGRLKDVRVKRLPPSIESHTVRQRGCYQEVLAAYADEFDWIGFFDADEYLRLTGDQSLIDFLDRPELVGAVAVNWCNYGSGGNVVKPSMPAFWAYHQHYAKNEMVNKHVKTFLRPKCWTSVWYNVHFFEVEPFLYDNASGNNVVWSNTPGITAEEAVWDRAKVMHYQCRSMEHFIERVRKRPDIPADPNLWKIYDHAEVTDESPRDKYHSIAVIMRLVIQASVLRGLTSFCKSAGSTQTLQTQIRHGTSTAFPSKHQKISTPRLRPQHDQSNLVEKPLKIRICSIETHFETMVRYSPQSGYVFGLSNEGSLGLTERILALSIDNIPGTAFLFLERRSDLVIIEQDPRLTDFLPYFSILSREDNKVFFCHSKTKLFLSSEPPVVGGKISASRRAPRDWEKFQLTPLDSGDIAYKDRRIKLLNYFLDGSQDLESFCSTHYQDNLGSLCSVFPLLILIKGSNELARFAGSLGALERYVF